MNREEKNEMIASIKDSIDNAGVFYLTDTSELDAESTSTLRRECFKNGIKLQVVKNTLLKKALESVENKDYEPLFETLKGNTSIMFSDTGNAPAKLIKEFRKNNDKPILKAAFIEEECYIGDDQLTALSEIKSKEELIGDVIAALQAPITNVVGSLQSGGNTISGLLKALEEKS